ncbi:MAG: sigma-70 family RNA polymerase sigma factor [Candidatus Hodarchaeota archaeon]
MWKIFPVFAIFVFHSYQRKKTKKLTVNLKIFCGSGIIFLIACSCRSQLIMSSHTLRRTQQLVTMAQGGDDSAMGQLCGIYAERVRRIVRFRMGPELRSQLESMDLVQEALIGAVKDIGDFKYSSNGDFLNWLSGIVENTIRDYVDRIHAAKRDVRRQVSLNKVVARTDGPLPDMGLPAVTTTPSVVLSLREELDRLEQAMDLLKPEYREVIILAKIEGLPCKEIAGRLNKSPAAVAMSLSRGILALTNLFERI